MSYIGEPEGAVTSLPFWVEDGTNKKHIGRVLEYKGVRYFYKQVERSRHFHRNHRAWAIQTYVADQFEKLDIPNIVLDVKDEGLVFSTTKDFIRKSVIDDFGHGEQYFLHQHWWSGFEWPPPVCGATLVYYRNGDILIDESCSLDKGHDGKHYALADAGHNGGEVTILWTRDARDAKVM